MIDIHTHILPNVDDGCSSLCEARNMLIDEINNGVTDIVLTPHWRKHMFEKSNQEINIAFNELKEACCDLDINLYLGREIYINDLNCLHELWSFDLLTMNKTQYLLLEFSYTKYIDITEVVYECQLKGYKVIVAHIERYSYLKKEDIRAIKTMGALIQVNASSIVGKNGRKIKLFVFQLIKDNLIDFVASDIHYHRSNNLLESKKIISKKFKDKEINLYQGNQKTFLIN